MDQNEQKKLKCLLYEAQLSLMEDDKIQTSNNA